LEVAVESGLVALHDCGGDDVVRHRMTPSNARALAAALVRAADKADASMPNF